MFVFVLIKFIVIATNNNKMKYVVLDTNISLKELCKINLMIF